MKNIIILLLICSLFLCACTGNLEYAKSTSDPVPGQASYEPGLSQTTAAPLPEPELPMTPEPVYLELKPEDMATTMIFHLPVAFPSGDEQMEISDEKETAHILAIINEMCFYPYTQAEFIERESAHVSDDKTCIYIFRVSPPLLTDENIYCAIVSDDIGVYVMMDGSYYYAGEEDSAEIAESLKSMVNARRS